MRVVRRGALFTVTIAAAAPLQGCPPSCDDLHQAYALDSDTYVDLEARYGVRLPQHECEDLCATAAADAEPVGGGTAAPVNDTWDSCTLIEIETAGYTGPGVLCEGTRCFPQGVGRPPAGLFVRRAGRGPFALAAAYEAASVLAFESLAAGLSAHRAPFGLVRAARRAARDELRHAAAMAALALRGGGTLGALAVAPLQEGTRSLEELARENATEGLVQEGWGARVLAHQARHASLPTTRRTLASVARDERRHFELSLAIQRWAGSRLGRGARARVADAAHDALDAVSTEPAADAGPGLPGRRAARALLSDLRGELAPVLS